MKIVDKIKRIPGSILFLIIAITIFLTSIAIKPNLFADSIKFALSILKSILLVFVLVYILLIISNYFINNQKLVKYFGHKKSIKGWFAAIITGIGSSGPIYMWYPLLSDLKEKGVKEGFIATFLYNRAIKIPLLPVMMIYFDIKFVIILTLVMIVISVIQGVIINEIMDIKNQEVKNGI